MMPPFPYHIWVGTDVKNREVSSALHQVSSDSFLAVMAIVIAVKPNPQSFTVSIVNCNYKLNYFAAVIYHNHSINLLVERQG